MSSYFSECKKYHGATIQRSVMIPLTVDPKPSVTSIGSGACGVGNLALTPEFLRTFRG